MCRTDGIHISDIKLAKKTQFIKSMLPRKPPDLVGISHTTLRSVDVRYLAF